MAWNRHRARLSDQIIFTLGDAPRVQCLDMRDRYPHDFVKSPKRAPCEWSHHLERLPGAFQYHLAHATTLSATPPDRLAK
jgi:hypothetical protein